MTLVGTRIENMIRKILIVSFVSLLISNCGIFKQFDKSFDEAFSLIMPDTCDIYLIDDVSGKFINDEIKFSYTNNRLLLLNAIDNECSKYYDSIFFLLYYKDSIDLFVMKRVNLKENPNAIIEKKYRIILAHDSIKEVKTTIRTNKNGEEFNKKYENND